MICTHPDGSFVYASSLRSPRKISSSAENPRGSASDGSGGSRYHGAPMRAGDTR